MSHWKSEKLKNLIQSEIRNMSVECDKAGGINLSQGICDLKLPEVLPLSAFEAMKNGMNHYTRYDGIDFLREQIAKKAAAFNHIKTDPGKNVVVSCGATGALFSACFALLNPGDEVLLFEPYYGYHEYTLLALDLVPVFCPLPFPDFQIDFDRLEGLVTERTKAILLNTPANPSGKVLSRDELNTLAEFCERHDLLVLSDEIYEYITFDGRNHISPGSDPRLADRTVTISGYSKTFSITGWRIGYSIANEEISKLIGYASDMFYVCAPAPLQYAVAAAIQQLPGEYYETIRKGYEKKRDLVCKVLNEIGLPAHAPEGAYYVLADATRLPGNSSKQKAMWLLNKTGVAVVPGETFFHKEIGKNLVRLCFAKDIEILEQACDQLQKAKKQWM